MVGNSQERAVGNAIRLLPDGTSLRTYVKGRANPRFTLGAVVLLALFGLAMFGAIVRGGTAIPSPILIYLLYRATCPRRGLVVADQGVALLKLSFVSDQPRKLIALVHPAEFQYAMTMATARSIRVGPDVVTIRRDDYPELLRAISPAPAPNPTYG